MKKNVNLFCAVALSIHICVGIVACNGPNGHELSDEQRLIEMSKLTDNVYYVVGHDAQDVAIKNDGNAESGGYLFISENLKDTVSAYTRGESQTAYKLFDGIFEFPAEIMSTSVCGFAMFPKEYRYEYPVKILSHRPRRKDEIFNPVCPAFCLESKIRPNKSIVVESLSKIEKP